SMINIYTPSLHDALPISVIVYSGKDFTEEEEFRLKKHVNAIVLKTDYSYKRLMDEVKLFLHKVKEHLPELNEGQLYRADESLKNRSEERRVGKEYRGEWRRTVD